MKRTLLATILLFTFNILLAQSDVEKKLKQEMWINPPAEFKTTDVPEKWKNESAVVLALERKYVGDFRVGMNKYYVEKLNIHFRIKLLDKAAVVEYSDLSFNDKTIRTNMFGRASTYRVIGIKVIKPDKSEKEVDLSKAVKADDASSKELKIPIPNLEPGDIIDYYIAMKDESLRMPDFGDEILLEGKYPVVSNTISFSIPHQFGFYSTPFNGAVDFKKEVVKNDEIYTLKNQLQDKAQDLLWEFEYRTSPHVRYRLTSESLRPYPHSEAKTALSAFNVNLSNIGYMEDFIKLNFKKEKDRNKIVRETYFMLRNPIYKKAYFNIDQGDPLGGDYTPNMFFFLMDKYLDKSDIPHEVLLVPSRRYGSVDNLVSLEACDVVMRVNINPPLYLSRPSPFALPGDIASGIEGMEGVSNLGSDRTTPVSTAEQNLATTTFTTSLDVNDMTKLQVKREVVAKGHTKIGHQYLVFTNYDYLKEYDQPKYQVESSRLMGGLIKEYNNEKTKFEQRLTQDYNERDTRIKAEIERDMDTKVSDYKLTVKNIGMWDANPNTEYQDEFTLENMTKKAGPNIILEVCKLIEKQTDVPEAQKSRTRDVYMDYARTFIQNINFTIPEGYTVEGLENLNKSVESDAGGFITNAEVNGNVLSIKTKKFYLKNFYPAADWPKITEFLNAAVNFYNAKLLLKKKN